MADFWEERKRFERSGDYILNDWTQLTIVTRLTNSLGEQFRWDIEPEADANSVPTRPAGDDTVLNIFMPLLEKLPKAPPLPHQEKEYP